MLSRCCPSFKYPCLYGNRSQTYTKECTRYWSDQGPVTESIEENTIFSECTSKSNDLALELVQYSAEDQSHCMDICTNAVCMSLPNEDEWGNLDFFSLDLGLRFKADTTVCITFIEYCGPIILTPIMRFIAPGDGRIMSNNFCSKFKGGIVYSFGFRQPGNTNFTTPEMFSLGWPCDINCVVQAQGKEALSFPVGIAYRNGGSFL